MYLGPYIGAYVTKTSLTIRRSGYDQIMQSDTQTCSLNLFPTDAPEEEWRLLNSTDGAYAVSSLGRIRHNIGTNQSPPGTIVSTRLTHMGLAVSINKKGRQCNHLVKTLVEEAFPLDGTGFGIYHIDGDPYNCRVNNLTRVQPAVALDDLPGEEWKIIPEYDDIYAASNKGRVKLVKSAGRSPAGKLIPSRKSARGEVVSLGVGAGNQRNVLIKSLLSSLFGDCTGVKTASNTVQRQMRPTLFYKDGDDTNNSTDNLTYTSPDCPLPDVLPGEEWRNLAIENAGHYAVSNFGRVAPTKWSKRLPNGGEIKWQVGGGGYASVRLKMSDGEYKSLLVHRLVAFTFLGKPPSDEYVVDHIDKNVFNPVLSNLRWITWQENHKDYIPGAKFGLSPKEAAEIRKLYAAGAKQVDLAEEYNVSQNQISMVVLNKAWKGHGDPVQRIRHPEVQAPEVEEWRDSPSYSDIRISNLGRVKINGVIKEFPIDDHGYVSFKHFGVYLKVHRLVAEAFIGPANGLQVNHVNGIRNSNNINNLEYVTNHQNARHGRGLSYITSNPEDPA